MKSTGNLPFDVFWGKYPKRVNKICALKEWKKLQDVELEEILAGIERWKQSAQWQDLQFVPDPERFLKYRRWEDEVPQSRVMKSDADTVREINAGRNWMSDQLEELARKKAM